MKAVIFFLLFGISQTAAQTLSFRTDGYYLFDNEQDTLFLIRTDNKEGAEMLEIFNAMTPGSEKPTHWAKGSPCLPDNTVATGNSSRLEMFAFFSDYMGNSSSAACWNEKVYQQFMKETQKAKNAFSDKNVSFLDPGAPDMRVTLKKDNSFIIRKGFSTLPNTSNRNAPKRVPEKITGTLYKDKIVVDHIDFQTSNPEFSKLINEYRKFPLVFKFYKFGQMPKSKNPYHVYREGSLWD